MAVNVYLGDDTSLALLAAQQAQAAADLIALEGLPTADPLVAWAFWNDAGVRKLSASTPSGIVTSIVGITGSLAEFNAALTGADFTTGGGTASGTNTGDQDLSGYAPLASPALTGTPTAPTAIAATNTPQIATTAFVQTLVANLIASAPGALDTLDELAAAMGDDANFAATVTTALAGKQPVDADLTAIAALNTTAFGRGFLDLADAAAGRTKLALGTAALSASADFAAAAPAIQAVASSATVTPTFSNDQVNITAQAAALDLANPTGTTVDGWGISIRIKDNGTARAITYGAQYRAIGVTLPTTTVISKTLYLGMIYNAADTKWDVVSVAQQA